MATKEQERKALAQIKKIIEGLGEDSYIGWAFEGCFEKAEENIENDWACSFKQQNEVLQHTIDFLKNDLDEARGLKMSFQTMVDDAQDEAERMRQRLAEENKRANEAWQRVDELNEKARRAQEVIDAQAEDKEQMAMEIMKLKAKLYDLMIK